MSVTGLNIPAVAGGRQGRARNLYVALCNIIVGPLSMLMLTVMVWRVLRGAAPAFDFRFAYWSAGHRVLAGASPYAWSASEFRQGFAFVYPALSALVFAPLALFSRAFGAGLLTLISVALAPTALWLMRVRDWRVYGVTLMWLPVYDGWMTANESLFLMLGLVCLWRSRERPVAGGLLTAALISLKPLMWPLALWLLATRRWRASAWALASGILLNLAAWSVVGFGQIGAYLRAMGIDTADSWRTGFGLPALLGHFGAGRNVGIGAMLVLSAALVAAIVHCAWVRRNQTQALVLVVALTTVSSPLVWSHYLVLLLVPLALLRPRLHWLWALPVLMWVCQPAAPVHVWQALIYWIAAAILVVALVRQAGSEAPALTRGLSLRSSPRLAGRETA